MSGPAGDLPDWIRSIAVADNPQQLINTPVLGLPYVSGTVNCRQWSSLEISVQLNHVAPDTVGIIGIQWFLGNLAIAQDNYTMWDSSPGNPAYAIFRAIIPIRGDSCVFTINSNTNLDTVAVFVIGSRRIVPGATIWGDQQGVQPALLAVAGIAMAIGQTRVFNIGPTHGPIGYQVALTGAGNEILIRAQVPTVGIALVTPRIVSHIFTDLSADTGIYCPGVALAAQVTNNSGVAHSMDISIFPERQ